ncbi:MAG: hypothetical protein HY791_25105 [Deltaproteobacteria bacterium]|nr:hypothetical protein [Deltaproteobacteria bacterium]
MPDTTKELAPPSPVGPIKLRGTERAATWLLSVDRDVAIEILKHLEPQEIAKLRRCIDEMPRPPPTEIGAVHDEFGETFDKLAVRLKGRGEYLVELTTEAIGAFRAAQALKPAEKPATGSFGDVDVDALSARLAAEHPQVIAAVLARLDPRVSGQVLEGLEQPARNDIIARIAQLSTIGAEAMLKVERALTAGLPTRAGADSTVDGVRVAASLLNQLGSDVAQQVLEALSGSSGDVAEEVKKAMFSFDDLAALDRRGLQTLLKEVPSEKLLLALKIASDDMLQKVFASLSKRAGEMMKDDLESMGPVRVSEVEASQQAIVGIAMKLRSEGRLAIAGRGGDEYV